MGAGASVFKKKGATAVAETESKAARANGGAAVVAETKAGSGKVAENTGVGEKVKGPTVSFPACLCT